MLPIDLPPPQPLQPPVAVVVAEPAEQYEAVIGACRFVEPNDPFDSAINSVPAIGPVINVLKLDPFKPVADARVRLLSGPKHGTLRLDPAKPGRAHHYFPKTDYRGKDEAAFEVQVNGKKYKVIYTLFVVDNVDHVSPKTSRLCRNPGVGYRISWNADISRRQERTAVIAAFCPVAFPDEPL